MSFDLGDTVPLTVEIRDAAGALTAASAVTLTLGLPDGTSATPIVTSPSTGRYVSDYVPAAAGRYTVRWTSTSPSTAISDVFDVRTGAPGYIVSLADARAHINMVAPSSATVRLEDDELRRFVEAGSEIVERYVGRIVARRTVVEDREFCQVRRVLLWSRPVLSLTTVETVDGENEWDVVDGLEVDNPTMGAVRVVNGALLNGYVRFTYVAGETTIPPNFSLAALEIIGHLWDSQRLTRLETRPGIDVEDDTFLTTAGRGFAIPPRAVALLAGHRPAVIA